jgi:GT2 family glycosyltransferase
MTVGVGFVVIGRNEGDRLVACLRSLNEAGGGRIVYVDSGSTDDSLENARNVLADIVRLDMTKPFTAARARNAGARRHIELGAPAYIQFIDGDCTLVSGWIESAARFLDAHPDVAVGCGRRREQKPEISVYNRLCDLEWATPVGEAIACGGDALMRTDAIAAVGFYDETLIAGEEPELCLRLREKGWRIERIAAEMTLHDAAITRFS